MRAPPLRPDKPMLVTVASPAPDKRLSTELSRLVAELEQAMRQAVQPTVLPTLRALHQRAQACLELATERRPPPPAQPLLSPRQLETLQLAARGMATASIGAALGVAPSTIRTHLEAIYRRLGARNRAEAISVAAQRGYLTARP